MKNSGISVEMRSGRLVPEVDADVSTSIAMLAVLAKEIARKGGIAVEQVFEIAKKGIERARCKSPLCGLTTGL